MCLDITDFIDLFNRNDLFKLICIGVQKLEMCSISSSFLEKDHICSER